MTELLQAVQNVERHVHEAGWDSAPRLYALVDTDDLLQREPQLAAELGVGAWDDSPSSSSGALTAIEQEDLPEYASLEDLLAGIVWPPEVSGTAIVVERVVVPPEVESRLPREDAEALRAIAEHTDRQEVRLAVGVLRDGRRACVARLRAHADDSDVLTGPDIAPGLAEALAQTLQDWAAEEQSDGEG